MQQIVLQMKEKVKLLGNYLIYIFIAIYTIVLSYFSILKHNTFMTTAWDLGIYEQVIWSTAHGKFFWYSIELPMNPSGCFFGIHFSPILLLVVPIYGILQATETLLILQSFVLGLGALPLYWIVKDEADRTTALAFASVYLLYLPLYGINLFDFHTQAFLPTLFLFAFYYFKKEKWVNYFIFIILALMVIEFVPFIVVFFGLYGLWVNRRELAQIFKGGIKKTFANKKILYSTITIILGIVWFIFAMKVISYFNPSPRPHPYWKEFGDPIKDFPGTIINMVSNPLKIMEAAISPPYEKLMYIVWLFAPVAFLSFLDPSSLLIGAPWFVASVVGTWHGYYKAVGYQYVAFVIPFIFISAFYGAKRLTWAINKIIIRMGKFKTPSTHTMTRIGKTMILLNIILLFLIFLNIILFNVFLADPGSSLHIPSVTTHMDALREIVKLIPSDASLLTQNDLAPHVCRRFNMYIGSNPVGDYRGIAFDYIFVDTRSKWYRPIAEFMYFDLFPIIQDSVKNGTFRVVSAIDGIWLLERGYNGSFIFPFEYGILGKFYNNQSEEPAFESAFFNTQWNWTQEPPFFTVNNNFTAVFTSYLYVDVAGNYTFRIFSQGGSTFSIKNWVLNGTYSLLHNETTAPIYLNVGYHRIEIRYWKLSAESSLTFYWKPPWKETFENIPTSHLFLKQP